MSPEHFWGGGRIRGIIRDYVNGDGMQSRINSVEIQCFVNGALDIAGELPVQIITLIEKGTQFENDNETRLKTKQKA